MQRSSWSTLIVVLTLALLSACAAVAESNEALVAAEYEADYRAALVHLQRGDLAQGRSLLEALVARSPRMVDAQRRLQNIRLANREHNALLREYGALLESDPSCGAYHYLHGRLLHRLDDQATEFEAARRADPDLVWGAYGLAWVAASLGDIATARSRIEDCLRIEPGHALSRVLLARLLVMQQKYEEAELLLGLLLREEPDLVEGWALLASVASLRFDRDLEIRARGRVIALGGDDGSERDRLVDLALDRPDSPIGFLAADQLRLAIAAPGRVNDPGWLVAMARLEMARGKRDEARALAARAFAAGRRDPALRPILESGEDWFARRLEFHDLDPAHLPEPLAALRDQLAAPGVEDESAEMVESLMAAGFLRMAERKLDQLQGRVGPEQTPALEAVADRLRRHRRVEARIALLAESLPEERAGEAAEDLEVFLTRVADIIEEETGYEAHRDNRVLTVPLVGAALDASLFLSGSINGYLRRTNQILYAGRLAGGRVQALLFTTVGGPSAVRPEGWAPARPCQEVVGMLAIVRPNDEVFGDSGGRALFGGYYLDLDVLTPWAARVAEVTRLELATRRRLLDDEGLPARTDKELRDLSRPGTEAEALVLRAFEIHGRLPLIEQVRVHEQGHLLDSQRYLPIWQKLLPNLGLVLKSGFSSTAVMAELEAAAQLHALREGPSPHLALAELVRALPRGGEAGPHARGYAEILRRFVDELARNLEAHPSIRTDRCLLHQLHRLSEGEIRALARSL